MALLVGAVIGIRADLLTDIVGGKYRAKTLGQYELMADGKHYAQIVDGNVLAFSLLTGQVEDTLFDIHSTKLNRLESIDGFVLSPKERYMLVYCNKQMIYRRSFSANYYLYDCQRKELKPLAENAPISTPRFSPDGNYICFSKNNNLYIYKVLFGTEVAVTEDGKSGQIINGTPDWLYEEEFTTTCMFSFSPDSKQLAFVRLDESRVPEFVWQTYLNEAQAALNAYPREYSLRYPRAGEQNAIAQVCVYDTYYKSVKRMDIGGDEDVYIPRLMWTNVPDQLAIFRLNRNQNKLDMLIANAKSTVSKLCYSEENKKGWIDYEQIDELQMLSDNSFIAISEQDGYRHVWLFSANGQRLKQLTKGRFDVTQFYGYDEQSATLYYQAALPTPINRTVYALNLKKNKVTAITSETGTHYALFTPDMNYFIDSYSSINEPPSYTLRDKQGKQVREMLNNNPLLEEWQSLGLPKKEFFSFVTERGDTLNGWILRPAGDSNIKHPALLMQYSGPASQFVYDRWKIDWEYYLVSEGILVAAIDPRGTYGRGRDFREQTYMQIGQKEAQDQVSAARYIGSLDCVDAARIGIWGWSYGGYMTLMAMTEPDSPFRCGISVAPVTDFRLYDSGYTERYMRRPQTNEKAYKEGSVIERAERLQGRVLLVHGLADDNVHCQNMWLLVDALVKADKQFDMQIYPDDNHFLRKRNNYQHLYQRKMEFLKQYLLE